MTRTVKEYIEQLLHRIVQNAHLTALEKFQDTETLKKWITSLRDSA